MAPKKAIALVVAVSVAGAALIVLGSAPPKPKEVSCGTANPQTGYSGKVPDVSGHTAEQVKTAVTIWQTAHKIKTKLKGSGPTTPDDAAMIAIAVARQESSLGATNAITGEGDAGVFQQRTKPGWYGTLKQVRNPAYAAETFLLGHTVTKAEHDAATKAGSTPAGGVGYHIPGLADVKGWQTMSAVDAAHHVQRSAFPGAVADDLAVARQMVASFRSGNLETPAAADVGQAACAPIGAMDCPSSGLAVEKGLTPDATRTLRCVHQKWPEITSYGGIGDRPATVDDHHQTGRAVDIMIPDWDTTGGDKLGGDIAAWAQKNAKQLGVVYIIWQAKIWSVERAKEGWRSCGSSAASCYGGPNDTSAHRDHVHVSVQGNAGGTDTGGNGTGGAPGRTVVPVAKYVITAHFGEVGSWARYHTGVDFAAPLGTQIRAAAGGTITHAGSGGGASGWAGTYVTIKHKDGTQTLYAHMGQISVNVGQQVNAGAPIGAVGLTGRTFGPHLHFETYPKGVTPGNVYQASNPENWLRSQGARP